MPSTVADSVVDETPERNQGLARKLTCSVVSIVVAGACLILLIQVSLTLTSVDDWGQGTRNRMIELEQANLEKLAEAKAGFVSEQFGRVRESILQLQAFAAQSLLSEPETMVVDSYLAKHSGLQQLEETFEFSVWFVPEVAATAVVPEDSSLGGLLNRSALMDIPYRGMQRQHDLIYLAALDDPATGESLSSQVNFQPYPGLDMSDFTTWGLTNDCPGYPSFNTNSYDPRCRPWYQPAIETGNTGVSFTNPYEDADGDNFVISAGAPVLNRAGTLVLGVVGLDMNTEDLDNSIKSLTVVDGEGYAYLLAPDRAGKEGDVAIHYRRSNYGSNEYQPIWDLEGGFAGNEAEIEAFKDVYAGMRDACGGTAKYQMGGATWILAWQHEGVSGADALGGGDSCGDLGGFIAVATVGEDVLLDAFSDTNTQIARVVILASVVMAAVLFGIGCVTVCIARTVASSVVQPVNQLIDVVHALNKLDFSKQPAGTWMVNDTSSPEVEELMRVFESMSTVVKFANTTLAGGDIGSARLLYVEALTLFTKLGNDRGVSIVNNNLGNVHTRMGDNLVAEAARERDRVNKRELLTQAHERYADAIKNYEVAIDDAEMLCAATAHQATGLSPLPSRGAGAGGGEFKDVEVAAVGVSSSVNADKGDDGGDDDDDSTTDGALFRQLASRKYNLALCLAAKGQSAAVALAGVGGQPDHDAINKARLLFQECIRLTSPSYPTVRVGGSGGNGNRGEAKNDVRRFGYLLKLSSFELEQQPSRLREAEEALDDAERILVRYTNVDPYGGPASALAASSSSSSILLKTPVQILQQRLLAARAAFCASSGYPEAAIDHYTRALISTGDIMDPHAARSSLLGLRGLADPAAGGDGNSGGYGRHFPSELLVALNLHPGSGKDPVCLMSAIDDAIARVHKEEARRVPLAKTGVDLCFVMDCTGSMQRWIDQARDKILDIVAQAKKDVPNISLRVAFVGYRDFGDKVQYVRLDFHREEELPTLITNMTNIRAYGGGDFPEDIAGGLKVATGLDWRSNVRLCILIADAPCHGTAFHTGVGDKYPNGCPNGNDPCALLYNLMYEIGADFYFVRITKFTDKMIGVFRNYVSERFGREASSRARRAAGATARRRDIKVHDLGSDENRFLEAVVESVVETYESQFEVW